MISFNFFYNYNCYDQFQVPVCSVTSIISVFPLSKGPALTFAFTFFIKHEIEEIIIILKEI